MIIHSYKIRVLAVALYVFATATAAHADGTHGCQTEITNSRSGPISVYTYNSADFALNIPHKKYTIQPGETKTVKAHSQNRTYCRMRIRKNEYLSKTVQCPNRPVNFFDAGAPNYYTQIKGKRSSFSVVSKWDCPGIEWPE